MRAKFLVIMGPSGVGKSTVMQRLSELDARFVKVKNHVTRPLRPGETERVSMPLSKLKEMRERGEVTQINHIYGDYYAALPKKMINEAMRAGMFPMVDYKIPFLAELKVEFPGKIFSVYLLPPNFSIIRSRLMKAGRQVEKNRIEEDEREASSLDSRYAGLIDLRLVNEEGKVGRVAEEIRKAITLRRKP
ncbi:MAG: hypothetical protein KGH94_01825 [Candidatus Micrarchaeota archaeon]|nr:hypothetical protein [Candidatus Micrarchaeota archaeon]